MKKLILIAIIIASFNAFATECVFTFGQFCKDGGDKIRNMCPETMLEKASSKCIADQAHATKIKNICASDIDSLCGDLTNFSDIYICLSYPMHWENMDKKCLNVLTEKIH